MKKKAISDEKRPTPINWDEVHRHLEIVRETIDRGWTPNSEEKKKILKERAKSLAREKEEKAVAEEYLEIMEFLLSHEKYGLESSYIREVYPLKELTPLPDTPAFLLGITNVRGQILSVIDLKKFFDLPEKGLTDLNKVIIVHNDRMELGILADSILGVRSIPVREMQPSLLTLTGVRVAYLKGVTDERLVVLDAEKILSDEKIIIHEEIG